MRTLYAHHDNFPIGRSVRSDQSSQPGGALQHRRRRCLVLADGFYEWRAEGKGKQPYRITLKTEEPFAFAGLWEPWTAKDGEAIGSCTIVTCEANDLLRSLHHRMPVILPPAAIRSWLDPQADTAALLSLLRPLEPDDFGSKRTAHRTKI